MKLRWLGILLMASFAFWATGAARLAHELLEHDADAQITCGVCGFRVPSEQQPGHTHNHDECAICQTLAAMTAANGAPPASVDAHAPCPHTLRLIQFSPRVICVAWLEPSCGPPVAAPTLAL